MSGRAAPARTPSSSVMTAASGNRARISSAEQSQTGPRRRAASAGGERILEPDRARAPPDRRRAGLVGDGEHVPLDQPEGTPRRADGDAHPLDDDPGDPSGAVRARRGSRSPPAATRAGGRSPPPDRGRARSPPRARARRSCPSRAHRRQGHARPAPKRGSRSRSSRAHDRQAAFPRWARSSEADRSRALRSRLPRRAATASRRGSSGLSRRISPSERPTCASGESSFIAASASFTRTSRRSAPNSAIPVGPFQSASMSARFVSRGALDRRPSRSRRGACSSPCMPS